MTAAGHSLGPASDAKHNDERETKPGRPGRWQLDAEADAARSITHDTQWR
jgi:hypothetical protein